jgi:prepilin-type N-terminal cleavage/methylation domain-containing protein
MKTKLRASNGFTLVELLIAVLILGFTLTGLIRVFLLCNKLAGIAQEKTAVMSLLQGKMEEIRDEKYDNIATNYASGGAPGDIFSLSPFDGMGVIYMQQFTAGDTDLLVIKIVGSWEMGDGRIIGEDLDKDGELDAGEDVDLDGDLSSVAIIMSFVASRD